MSLTELQQLHKDMLTNCRFCVVCGHKLEIVGRWQKGCPNTHGLLEISDSEEGVPSALFLFEPHLYQGLT